MSKQPVTPERVREVLLKTVQEFSEQRGSLQTGPILEEVRRRITSEGTWSIDVLMTLWSDLFLQGLLGWGYNIENANPPWLHLTARGRSSLERLSRDPANPDGYRGYLVAKASLNAIADSYITEGVRCYNAACYKAAAVMVGGAAESLLLELRDAVESRLTTHGRPVPPALTTWKALSVLKALRLELDAHRQAMPVDLREAYDAYWPAFTQQIRAARNDAGHPTSVAPVTPETVHASLLIFPELAVLARTLIAWVSGHMP